VHVKNITVLVDSFCRLPRRSKVHALRERICEVALQQFDHATVCAMISTMLRGEDHLTPMFGRCYLYAELVVRVDSWKVDLRVSRIACAISCRY
jgi:hypothetical protein